LQELNSAEFLKFLESLTGIEGLIGDPYYEGGGIHETKKGGFLKVHTDFNYHKKLKLDRRINLLLYLNSDWKEEYGGHLELWDTDMSSCRRKLLPVINRMVIFSTTDFSYHGHPEPLSCPDNRSRRSLAFYYYTNGRPGSEVQFDKSTKTNYQERPGEAFENKGKKPLRKKLRKRIAKLFKK
jgi:Rps23 Pro-64 3,4-dihydroxylase Tpa1-like proline 4-hydroxylase